MSTKDKLIASAQKNLEKGQIQKAIKDYEELVKLEPKTDQFRQRLAELLSRANRPEEAISHYEILAKEYADKGFYPRAIAVYKQIQKLDASKTAVYHRLAELNKKQGMIGNAMSEYRSLLDYYEKRKMIFESGEVLLNMADLEPENLALHLRAIQFLIQSKILEKVSASVANAVEIFQKKSDTEKIQKLLEATIPKLSEHKDVLLDLVKKFESKSYLTEAVLGLEALVKISPDDPELLGRLAGIYQQLEDTANERLVLAHLVKVAASGKVCERLIRLCIAGGDLARAKREIEQHAALLDEAGCKAELVSLCGESVVSAPVKPAVEAPSQTISEEVFSTELAITDLLPPEASDVELALELPEPVIEVPPPVSSPRPVVTAKPVEVTASSLPDTIEVETPASAEISLDFLEDFISQQEEVLPAQEVAAVEVIHEPELELEVPDSSPADEFLEVDAIDEIDSGEIELDISELSFLQAEIEPEAQVEPPSPTIVPQVMVAPDLEEELLDEELDLEEIDLEIVEELDEEELLESKTLTSEFAQQLETATETGPELDLGAEEDLLEEIEDLEELEELALDDLEVEEFATEADQVALPPDEYPGSGSKDFELELDIAVGEVETAAVEDLLVAEEPLFSDELTNEIESILAGAASGSPLEVNLDELDGFVATDQSVGDATPLSGVVDELITPATDFPPASQAVNSIPPPLDFQAEFDEVDFYLKQGLPDNAEKVCRKILDLDPRNDQAISKLADAEILRQRKAAEAAAAGDDDFFDLASEVLDDGAFKATAGLANVEDVDRFRFDNVFSEFKKGIEAQIDSEDAEAHYNLGIAYKEMGLIDDAIGEFEKAMGSRSRQADCVTLIGICHAERGAFDQAEVVFRAGIARGEFASNETIGIEYELGLVYEVWGRPVDALGCFDSVAKIDPFFRGAAEKARELRASLGMNEPVATAADYSAPQPEQQPAASSKNRVSFL